MFKDSNRNYHIYPTTIVNESRIMKETSSMVSLALTQSIRIVGVGDRGLARRQRIDESREITRLTVLFYHAKGKLGRLLFYTECYIRYFFYLLFRRVDLLNCHSLMLLPVAVMIKWLKRCRLIYDTHELETERTGLAGIEKRISKGIERMLIRYCDRIITVGPEITKWYRNMYKLNNVYTVRNIPSNSLAVPPTSRKLRDIFNVSDSAILFIYQGYFMPGRGLEVLLEAFKSLPDSYQIVFMGEGTLQPELEKANAGYTNIHFHRTVPYSQILDYTSSCDVGLSLFENTCLSHYYALPNKVFEYIKSNLPILASNFPEMRNLVKSYDCGWLTEPNKDAVVQAIMGIDAENLKIKKRNAIKAANELSWEREELELLKALSFTS